MTAVTDRTGWMDAAPPAERWLPAVAWEGLYEVSDLGRVRSLTRWTPAGTRKGRLLKTNISPSGYPQLGFRRDGKSRTQAVHRLVAAAFLGPRPEGQEVRHLDGNKINNRLDNLAYGTPSENSLDSIRHGTHPSASKTHCKRGHLFDEENTIIRPGNGRKCRMCEAIGQAKNNAARSERRARRRAERAGAERKEATE